RESSRSIRRRHRRRRTRSCPCTRDPVRRLQAPGPTFDDSSRLLNVKLLTNLCLQASRDRVAAGLRLYFCVIGWGGQTSRARLFWKRGTSGLRCSRARNGRNFEHLSGGGVSGPAISTNAVKP